MVWTPYLQMASGLSNDKEAERLDSGLADITVASKKIALNLNVSGVKINRVKLANSSVSASGKILALSGWMYLDTAPTAEVGLWSTSGSGYWLKIGTDKKIKFYNDAGTLIASSTSTVSTSSGSPTEFIAFIDTISASTVYIWLFMGTAGGSMTEEIAAYDTGMTDASFAQASNYFGDVTASGSNFGCVITAQFVTLRYTTTTADAVYNTPYPRLVAHGGTELPATSEGDAAAWANGTTASPNTWQDVDETTGNDGSTTKITDTQTTDPKTRHKHLFKWSAANLFDSSMTIDWVQVKCVGEVNTSGKNFADFLIKLGGTEASATAVGGIVLATYFGYVGVFLTKPAGGAWAYTDLLLSAGVSLLQFGGYSIVQAGVDTSVLWSIVQVEGVYHTATVTGTGLPSGFTDTRQPALMGTNVGLI